MLMAVLEGGHEDKLIGSVAGLHQLIYCGLVVKEPPHPLPVAIPNGFWVQLIHKLLSRDVAALQKAIQ